MNEPKILAAPMFEVGCVTDRATSTNWLSRCLVPLTLVILVCGWHVAWPNLNRDFNHLHGWQACQEAHLSRGISRKGLVTLGFAPIVSELFDAGGHRFYFTHYPILGHALLSLLFAQIDAQNIHRAIRLAGMGVTLGLLVALYVAATELWDQRYAAWAVFFGAVNAQVLYFFVQPYYRFGIAWVTGRTLFATGTFEDISRRTRLGLLVSYEFYRMLAMQVLMYFSPIAMVGAVGFYAVAVSSIVRNRGRAVFERHWQSVFVLLTLTNGASLIVFPATTVEHQQMYGLLVVPFSLAAALSAPPPVGTRYGTTFVKNHRGSSVPGKRIERGEWHRALRRRVTRIWLYRLVGAALHDHTASTPFCQRCTRSRAAGVAWSADDGSAADLAAWWRSTARPEERRRRRGVSAALSFSSPLW